MHSLPSKNDKKTLLCLTALCLEKTRWSADLVRALGVALEVPSASLDGAITLLYNPTEHADSMLDRAESMATGLRSSLSKESAVFGLVMILLLILREGQELAASWKKNKKKAAEKELLERMLHFDGRTSVILRRLALVLRVKISALAALEDIAIREMQQEAKLFQQGQKQNDKKGKNSWMRTAKIGAAATAAGGLLFVTGGLAAPALATGLAGLGLAGVATLATTTTVAALLGAGGAGLGAYKMSRRTAGLERFEFQKVNRNDFESTEEEMKGMTVYICVSGYLRQPGPAPDTPDAATTKMTLGSSLFPSSKQSKDAASSPDFYGPWGAQPPRMFPTQMLERFYAVVAPEKQKIIPYLLERYTGQEEELMDELGKRYRVHPKTLQPAETRPDYYVTGERGEMYYKLILHLIDKEGKTDFIFTEEVMATMMDPEKLWDEPHHAPKPVRTLSSFDGEEGIKTEEEMKRKMAEIETKMSGPPDGETPSTLDKETMDDLSEEIERIGLKQSGSSPQPVGNETKTNTVDTLVNNEVYWWRTSVASYGDQYTVVWDPDKLLSIGRCFENLIAEGAQKGVTTALTYTALSAVVAAVALPLQIANLINNLDESWTMAIEAADEAGKLLADALMSETHGNRPVVLIGYSVGGRVVAACLSELAKIAKGGESQQELPAESTDDFGILSQQIENDSTLNDAERQRRLHAATVVRDAVIIGAPCDTISHKWAKRRSVVCGRLINVYSRHDWVLSLLYRFRRLTVLALAGLQEVKLPSSKDQTTRDSVLVSPIENFNVSDIVSSHGDYPAKINEILERIGVGDVNREKFHSNYFLTADGEKQDS